MENKKSFKSIGKAFIAAVTVSAVILSCVSCSLKDPASTDKGNEVNTGDVFDEFAFAPPLEEIGEDYTLEDAENDGCVIMKDGDISAGQDIWQDFYDKSLKGEKSGVRYVHYHDLDINRVAYEHYEKIKDDYPVMYVFDLIYDGSEYRVRYIENGEEEEKSFKYLMRYEGEFPAGITYKTYLRYVLTNDDTIVWQDIENSMYSSDLEKSRLYSQVMQVYIDVE
ncbi:MAG: hypothetical protein E7665_09725 [Ruminococcaceae bacterium]|nr:hypothetical protein [Oscillospiraceae bacterium]